MSVIDNIRLKNKNDEVLADLLQLNRSEILAGWVEQQHVNDIFTNRHINSNLFIKYFGSRILNYFIAVARNEKEVGGCPAVMAMLTFFSKRGMMLDEVYRICAGIKNIITEILLANEIKYDSPIFKKAIKIFDLNFSSVIREYIKELAGNKKNTAIINNSQKIAQNQYHVYKYLFNDSDFKEFTKLQDDISAAADKLVHNQEETSRYKIELSEKFKELGIKVFVDPIFNELSENFNNLSVLFEDSLNSNIIENDKKRFILLIKELTANLDIWRKNLLNSDENGNQYDDTPLVLSTINLVKMLLNKK